MPHYGVAEIDIRTSEIVPTQTHRDSTDALGQREILQARLQEEGYLFFRGLLDKAAIAATRRRMLAPLVAASLASDDGEQPVWTGGDRPHIDHTDPAFDGICRELFEWPGITEAIAQVLGEPVSLVPMAQYRAYRPDPNGGFLHQDGFFSPGIRNYLPLWIPLVPMNAEMGGLVIAAGMTGKGYFHNEDKATPFPIPARTIPDDVWSRADYAPGDLLVVHPETPHAGLPNRSDRVRVSLDTRVQSARHPSVVVGHVISVAPDELKLECDDGSVAILKIDDETFIRTEHAAIRMTREEFVTRTPPGKRLLASFEKDRAAMLRQPDR